jgi:TatA/E family protein of Tat protein translocase
VPPFLLILESFGTSELILILVVALIFFGPRKLPQLSRQIGKSLAEFKRASDDFKRTWEREVALETPSAETDTTNTILPQNSSLAETTVGRGQPNTPLPDEGYAANLETTTSSEAAEVAPSSEPPPSSSSKRDWL